jgi:VanZ family protein
MTAHAMPLAPPRANLSRYLLMGYTLFIVYASLSPFTGWQAQGLSLSAVLQEPLTLTFTPFDFGLNLLTYIPFGFLLALLLHTRLHSGWAGLGAALLGLGLSAAMECTQLYLPNRVSSNCDLLSNALGSVLGAIIALNLATDRGMAWLALRRKQWLRTHRMSDFGLALVWLWMFAQINPSLPMLGNLFIRSEAQAPFMLPATQPINLWASTVVALNVLMLGGLLLTLLRDTRNTLVSLLILLCGVALAKFLTAALLLKSWALLLWLNGDAMLGMVCGVLILAIASPLNRRLHRTLTACATLLYLLLTQILLDATSPAAAMPLFHWRYLHLLNYNGLTQSVVLLFPFLLLSYLWQTRRRA